MRIRADPDPQHCIFSYAYDYALRVSLLTKDLGNIYVPIASAT